MHKQYLIESVVLTRNFVIIWHSAAITDQPLHWPARAKCLLGTGCRTYSFLPQLYPEAHQPQPHPTVTATAPPSVTTDFFTLIRKHFQHEAKLASTHLSWFWSCSHLVSPIGSQQMENWAHVLGEAMGMSIRMLDGGRRGGVKLYHSSHVTHSDSPTPIWGSWPPVPLLLMTVSPFQGSGD